MEKRFRKVESDFPPRIWREFGGTEGRGEERVNDESDFIERELNAFFAESLGFEHRTEERKRTKLP